MKKPSDTLLVSIVQADLHWADKRANLAMFEELIGTATDKMEVVVLPEMFSTGFVMEPEPLAESMEGDTVQWMKRLCSERKIIIVGSIIVREADNYFNRLIWMLPNGAFGYYDKRHLFGYAGENEKYSPGKKRLIASVKGWKLNLQVCYDLRFPVWARQSVPMEPVPTAGVLQKASSAGSPEYDILVYVANWPAKRSHAWKTLLQARAIENQCYVVGTNRVGTDAAGLQFQGDSMIVDPMGEILKTATGKPELFTCELKYEHLESVRKNLPFLKDADPFIIGN